MSSLKFSVILTNHEDKNSFLKDIIQSHFHLDKVIPLDSNNMFECYVSSLNYVDENNFKKILSKPHKLYNFTWIS